MSETPTAPATILPGSALTLNYSVQNAGSGNSIETDLAATNPDNTKSLVAPFTLNAGSSIGVSSVWNSAPEQQRQPGESDATYQSRLAGLDNGPLSFSIALSWKDASSEIYGPTVSTVGSTRILPIVTNTVTAPQNAKVGDTITYAVTLQHKTTSTYSPLQQVLTVSDPLGHTTTNAYDNNGNLLTAKDALGNVTTNTYSPNGLLATTQDALHNTTSFGYDGSGNLTSQTDANHVVTSYSYDANGNRQTQSVTRTLTASQGGGTQALLTQFAYDGNNRLTKTTYPDGTFTQVQYNSLGQQAATIDAKNNTTSYTYDNDGRLTLTKYPDGATESSTYDGNGNRLTSTDRAGHVTSYTLKRSGTSVAYIVVVNRSAFVLKLFNLRCSIPSDDLY